MLSNRPLTALMLRRADVEKRIRERRGLVTPGDRKLARLQALKLALEVRLARMFVGRRPLPA